MLKGEHLLPFTTLVEAGALPLFHKALPKEVVLFAGLDACNLRMGAIAFQAIQIGDFEPPKHGICKTSFVTWSMEL